MWFRPDSQIVVHVLTIWWSFFFFNRRWKMVGPLTGRTAGDVAGRRRCWGRGRGRGRNDVKRLYDDERYGICVCARSTPRKPTRWCPVVCYRQGGLMIWNQSSLLLITCTHGQSASLITLHMCYINIFYRSWHKNCAKKTKNLVYISA